MHDQPPVEAPAPPPAVDHHHHHHHHHHHDIHTPQPPDYPPPSYDDATNSLLVGAPPGYGTTFPDQSSIASSDDPDDSELTLPKLIGQIFVVFVFLGIVYSFWFIVTAPHRP